jgi:hypothetical protein
LDFPFTVGPKSNESGMEGNFFQSVVPKCARIFSGTQATTNFFDDIHINASLWIRRALRCGLRDNDNDFKRNGKIKV